MSHEQGDGGGAKPFLPQVLPDGGRPRDQGVVGGPQDGRHPHDESLSLQTHLGRLVPGEDVHVPNNKYWRISRDSGLSDQPFISLPANQDSGLCTPLHQGHLERDDSFEIFIFIPKDHTQKLAL